MRIGWVGLGKLGLPCALALVDAGHEVSGFDVSDRWIAVQDQEVPHWREEGLDDLLGSGARVTPAACVDDLVAVSDVVFVAVQTPHAPRFGGESPMPEDSRDFDYSALTQAVRSVADAAQQQERRITVVVVSTALPGTFNRCLRALKNRFVTIVYNPFFIAMGTTIHDFIDPEFVLVGVDDPDDAEDLHAVYRRVHDRPLEVMSIESAELTKVVYNTFISAKIVFANTVMEICHKTGACDDEVIGALVRADQRVTSGAYLRGGMGDGGHCHPRDLIAMRELARRLDLSVDLMGFLARARELQSKWLAREVLDQAELTGLPIVVLGKAYKPESDLVGGSPALLLHTDICLLGQIWPDEGPRIWDPVIDGEATTTSGPAVFVVATQHEQFRSKFDYPVGSVVVDPWGYVEDRSGVTVIRVGRKR